MKTITVTLIGLFVLFSCLGVAQDSLTRSARSLKIYSGVPFQKEASNTGWHHTDFELGFDVLHSVELKSSLFLSLGAGVYFAQYRTEAYTQTYQTIAYSPLSGSNINTYEDDYERQTVGRFTTFRVPLYLEYMPTGKWKPYARLGTALDLQIQERYFEVYAHTLQRAPAHVHATPNSVHSNAYLLSVVSSGGVKYQMGQTALLLGVYMQIGMLNVGEEQTTGRLGVGAEFIVRKTLSLDERVFKKRL